MITDATAENDQNGRVMLTEHERKRVLNLIQDLMSQVTTLPMSACRTNVAHIHEQTRSKELTKMT